MKTILVPTDFSKCSLNGLEFAASLAKKTKAKLHIINVVEPANFFYASNPVPVPPQAAELLSESAEKMKELSVKNLNALLEKNYLSGVHSSVYTLSGNNIHKVITEFSKEINSDLIVMGTHGSTGLKGIFLGSTAERVVRFSDRPVIVVPAKIKSMNIRSIVFASDFDKESYAVFPVIRNFAEIYNSKIHLLKVNVMEHFKKTSDNVSEIDAFNKKFSSNYQKTVYDDYSIEEGILNFADQSDADLIAIGTHGKKGLARFFKPDVSEDTLRLTHKPILVINFNKDFHKGVLIYEEEADEIIL